MSITLREAAEEAWMWLVSEWADDFEARHVAASYKAEAIEHLRLALDADPAASAEADAAWAWAYEQVGVWPGPNSASEVADLAFALLTDLRAAIRSAGTPPASREADAPEAIRRAVIYVMQLSDRQIETRLSALFGEEMVRALAQDGFTVAAATPPEPVGGREALLREALEQLRDHGYQPMYNGRPSCPFCRNFVDFEETHQPGCLLLGVLQASPPTGVSNGVALPLDADYEKMRMERGWPTPNHMRRTADALDSMTPAKYGDVLRWFADLADASLPPAREQADSEPPE